MTNEQAEKILSAFEGAGMRIEPGATFSARGQIVQLLDGCEHLLSMDHKPIPMLLWCPECGHRHVDRAEFATKIHHTHACQECGHIWRPAIGPTFGVQFLPGFRDNSLTDNYS